MHDFCFPCDNLDVKLTVNEDSFTAHSFTVHRRKMSYKLAVLTTGVLLIATVAGTPIVVDSNRNMPMIAPQQGPSNDSTVEVVPQVVPHPVDKGLGYDTGNVWGCCVM